MIKKHSTEHKQPYPLIADDFNGLKRFIVIYLWSFNSCLYLFVILETLDLVSLKAADVGSSIFCMNSFLKLNLSKV